MTVEDAINNYMGQNIKLGAETGYIYAGRVTQETASELEEISNEYLMQLKRTLERAKRHNTNFEERWITTEARIWAYWEKERKSKRPTRAEQQKIIKKRKESDRARTQTNLKILPKWIAEFTPILSREVREIYPSLYGDSTIILFEGREYGPFWTLNENETKPMQVTRKKARA